MGAMSFFDPRKYRLYGLDAAAEDSGMMMDPGLAPGENIQAAMSAPAPSFRQGEFDPGDIDVTMGPMPTPGKGPSRVKPILAAIARHAQAGIDAAATPNIAGGGGSDIMRALSQSRDMQRNRDMASEEMDRRRRMEQSQIEENRAQSEWYRQRAATAASGAWVNDGNGMQHNTATRERREVGGVSPAAAKAAAEAQQVAARKQMAEQAGWNLSDPRVVSWIYGANNAMIPSAPKTTVRTGAQGQSVFVTYDEKGMPHFNAELPGPPRMGTVRGANNETVFTEQRPGSGGVAVSSIPGPPPRTAAPRGTAGTGGAPSHTAVVNAFVDRLMRDAQSRGISLEYAIPAAENPQNYTDIAPSVRLDAVARLRRQLAAGAKTQAAGAGGGTPWAGGRPGRVTVTAAGVGGREPQTTQGPRVGETRQHQGATYRFDGMRWVAQ